jgi:hypothetical protein
MMITCLTAKTNDTVRLMANDPKDQKNLAAGARQNNESDITKRSTSKNDQTHPDRTGRPFFQR